MIGDRLDLQAPHIARHLQRGYIKTSPQYTLTDITVRTQMIPVRDGTLLATDIYLPPQLPAPTIVVRTPYGRASEGYVGSYFAMARRGYAVVSQDCRGTGQSEPDHWDYYVFEPEDGYDLIAWIREQTWCDGFIGSCGGSYIGQTQWGMAMHEGMSTVVPDVSGLGIATNTVHLHMFENAYERIVGKGAGRVKAHFSDLEKEMLPETLASGFYNQDFSSTLPERLIYERPDLAKLPLCKAQRRLWEEYAALPSAGRASFLHKIFERDAVSVLDIEASSDIFGPAVSHDAHTLPFCKPSEITDRLNLPILMRTGWYDWGLNDALSTWDFLQTWLPESSRSQLRLFISPSAHNAPGYHEGMGTHPELQHSYGVTTTTDMLLEWYETVRKRTLDRWPNVIYYLMGANEWRTASQWPPADTTHMTFYLDGPNKLALVPPKAEIAEDSFVYDPLDPTPTIGGSIVSFVYSPGSVDVSAVQDRSDVLAYTSNVLDCDLDVVGPLRLILFASSTAIDTDFCARLSDVFPDGRALQLQSTLLRARYRDIAVGAQPLEKGKVYEFGIDLWATANRFKAGHRIRLDISSADFPRFDRNTNRGGEPGAPLPALQRIFRDVLHPSRLILSVNTHCC